jgi:glucosyl-dolichyl phosphate glucuronosyltransferase
MTERISVIMSTRNRAAVLTETLSAMERLKRDALGVEFVVVDNGSSDRTPAVLSHFRDRLPLRCLEDRVPGKTHALNSALRSVELGDLVVFTDDDITPDDIWLEAIVATSKRWPRHSVFGGRIEPTWPNGHRLPSWAREDAIQTLAFAKHHLGERECEYPAEVDPFGGNYWIRAAVLGETRFLEGMGAQPKRPTLGDETQFVRQLRRKGLVPVYSPAARVQHRVEMTRLTKVAVYRRAMQGGKGFVYSRGLPDEDLFRRSLARWRLRRSRAILETLFSFPAGSALGTESQRVLAMVQWIWGVAQNAEALRISAARDRSLIAAIGYCPPEEWLA